VPASWLDSNCLSIRTCRHGKGYQLANNGADTRAIQAYMGHKNIQHTVLYTKLDPARFKGFGKNIKL